MINDAARKYTDAELKKLERDIHRAYQKAYKELNDKWQDALATAKAKEKPFLDAYEAAKKSGDKDLIRETGRDLAHIHRQNTLESEHYQRARDNLAHQLAELDKSAYALANGKLNAIYAANYNALAGQLPAGYAYGLITPQTVRNLLTKELNLVKATTWNAKLMNEQVLQGILQGESMGKIAKRFANVLGMNEQSAIRNARTSVTYAENQGRLDSYHEAEDNGTVLVKVWSATHDSRTRESHMGIDGEEKPLDKEFSNGLQCPGDPHGAGAEVYNCRCAMGTRIIGFRKADGSIVYVDGNEEMEEDLGGFYDVIGSPPERPRRADFDSDEAYYAAREQYRAEYDKWNSKVEEWASTHYNNSTPVELGVEWANIKGVVLDGSLAEVDPEILHAFLDRLGELNADFPFVISGMTADAGSFIVDCDRTDLHATMSANIFGISFNALGSNASYWSSEIAGNVKSGFLVAGDSPLIRTFDHEFGHCLFGQIQKNACYKLPLSMRNHDAMASAMQEVRDDFHNAVFGKAGMSEYAATNDDELFAEAFAAWYGGEKTEFANAMGAWLHKMGVI